MGIHGTLYAQAHCNPSHQKSLDNQYTHVITYVMLARQITIPSPFPPITSLQAQHYHAIAHSFAQRQPSIPSIFNSFRTLSIATGVVPPSPSLWPPCSDLSALCVGLFSVFAGLRRHMRLMHPEWIYGMRHVVPLSPAPSVDCAYFPSPRGWHPFTPAVSPLRQLRALCDSLPRGSRGVYPEPRGVRYPLPFLVAPLFSQRYKSLFPEPLYFHIHAKPRGVWGAKTFRHSDVETFRRSDVPKKQKPRLATGPLP